MKNLLIDRKIIPWWKGIIIVALVYFLTARIGLVFALPPGYATPYWPPTGVALAALLTFGPSLWPGIFLGSLLANSWPFLSFYAFPANLGIAVGAALQAVVGVYLLRFLGVSYRNLFESNRHIFFFLLTAFVSCLINATMGTLSIYGMGLLNKMSFAESWLTWWLGDAMGVTIFAPLLLVWYLPIDWRQLSTRRLELFILLLTSLAISYLCFIWLSKPLAFIFIPILLWAVLRFPAHVSIFILLIISSIALWGTIHQRGPFVQAQLNTSLLILQAFMGVITGTVLAVIAVLNELKHTHELLEEHSQELESKVTERTSKITQQAELLHERNQNLEQNLHQIKVMQKRIISQEKLATLGALTLGLGRQMQNPLNFVINFSELSLELSNQLKEWLVEEKTLTEETHTWLSETLTTLEVNLTKVYQYGKSANKVVERMVFHIQERTGIYQSIELNALIEEFINLTYYTVQTQHPHFIARIEKHYDKTIGHIETIPEDVTRAFVNILNNAFDSLIEKQHHLGATFTPILTIETKNGDHEVLITIRDNGMGISKEMQKNLFVPFSTTKQGEGAGFGLSISQDLIVHHLEGDIQFDSQEGEFAQFIIILPTHRNNQSIDI